MEEVGEALFASTITTGIGFSSLILASLLITQRLGLTLTLSVLCIFAGTILIIPPVLLLKERILKKLYFNYPVVRIFSIPVLDGLQLIE